MCILLLLQLLDIVPVLHVITLQLLNCLDILLARCHSRLDDALQRLAFHALQLLFHHRKRLLGLLQLNRKIDRSRRISQHCARTLSSYENKRGSDYSSLLSLEK